MRRVPSTALRPGMRVGHAIYNSNGEILLNSHVILKKSYIDSLIKMGIPAIYIIDESLPDFYVEDIIDEKTRVDTIRLTKNILKDTDFAKSPLNKAHLSEARKNIVDIIDQLLEKQYLMVNMVDIRSFDDYLFGHSVNVCVLSLITGISLGYNKTKLMLLGMGALMHDIGKTLIPAKLLNKPGTLTTDEFNVVKQHSELGYTILSNCEPHIKKISALIALQHHERFNGEGYPQGLCGLKSEIHEFSQITGIADVYDAMTADRVYRKAHPPYEAYEMLAGSGNFFFDYKLVRSFLSNIAAYPAGSLVRLSTNEIAMVTETAKGYSLYPKIIIIFDAEEKRLEKPVEIDLSKQNTVTITKVLEYEEIQGFKIQDEGQFDKAYGI
ncbi:HD-GYP domain-containing protein [Pelotomaculum isophthalicicum JI]|uniref:HD-GYP domain-containing protein n=1 Tax=Pelotomaculum isophthalicicum JI TaxID=947010 RepID=A0A9X4JWG5_9FIRM|nr:HD-GYP domain-containing protein [Pelotomaculum isophthalicicum]MDF9409192.1 HD-GYP domain-containing protein [Pelotomaculum isophthalicicum JI]